MVLVLDHFSSLNLYNWPWRTKGRKGTQRNKWENWNSPREKFIVEALPCLYEAHSDKQQLIVRS